MATPQQIAALYQQYLGREPDAEGLAFYSNPDFSLQLIEQDIANSAEAKGRAPLDVNALYGSLTNNEAAALSTARDINTDYPITRGDTVYNFLADGSIQVIKPTSLEGSKLGATVAQYSSTGDVQVAPYFNADFGKTGFGDLLGKALIATTAGAVLGPAGIGLSTPAAAAAATGATTLGTGGSIEDAAKAALLSGVGAYGAEQVTGLLSNAVNNAAYDAAAAAADAAQMANQGLDAATIAQNLSTYVDPATAASIANTATTQANSLAYATQLTAQGFTPTEVVEALRDAGVSSSVAQTAAQSAAEGVTQISAQNIVSGATFQPQTRAPVQATPGAVEVTAAGVQAPAAATTTAATTAAGGLLGGATAPTQTLQVQGQGLLSEPTQAAATTAGGLIGTTQPTQTVDVQAQRQARINNLYQTILGRAPDAAGLAFYSNPQFTDAQIEADIRNSAEAQQRQQVTVPGSQVTTPTGTAAGTAAGGLVGSTVNAPQNVEVVDRSFQSQTFAPVIPVTPTQTVNVDGRGVQTATANIGPVAGGAATIGPGAVTSTNQVTVSPTNKINLSLLDAAAITALMGGINSLLGPGDQAPVVDQAALDAIINAPRPIYPRGTMPGTPGMGGMPGVGGFMPGGTSGGFYRIAPTGVYNPFATAAPFGAGRFGATAQPITLPGLV